MRKGVLAALAVLLAGHGMAFAQQYGSSTAGHFGDLPAKAPAPGDVDAQAETFGFYGSGEYLLWWIKNGRVPPLVTGGDKGVPGSPGTRILVDSLDFVDDLRQGGRFALGYRFETIPSVGVEANYFFLSDQLADVGFSSGGDPVLGRPYLDVATGMPAATLISSPGVAAGT